MSRTIDEKLPDFKKFEKRGERNNWNSKAEKKCYGEHMKKIRKIADVLSRPLFYAAGWGIAYAMFSIIGDFATWYAIAPARFLGMLCNEEHMEWVIDLFIGLECTETMIASGLVAILASNTESENRMYLNLFVVNVAVFIWLVFVLRENGTGFYSWKWVMDSEWKKHILLFRNGIAPFLGCVMAFFLGPRIMKPELPPYPYGRKPGEKSAED